MEPQAHYGDISLAEALSRLAHEIRDSRKVSQNLLMWLQSQPQSNADFNEKQLKRFFELDGSIKSAIKAAKDEIILKQCGPTEGHKFNYSIGLPVSKTP